uniref:Uncharacterized protein n=1 Tax=Chromera velia CCMP2878 TaxID=1169474 RepID=A0A0G4GWP8_9ALVE|eukprot:Cvel_23694.t1-p1 / transcript=Cvel_23694.t1 / gene=Cvel_23694 / organism=Chromera_velia_CCMP2878 / gene_product=hypothetical protein / transcript_product=hypothetical protein / location=Cvel_scaffold2472:12251-13822(-) / protein_length=524 / sequence_SO=supercontig / SO=protein_coding / is_pseudo=false
MSVFFAALLVFVSLWACAASEETYRKSPRHLQPLEVELQTELISAGRSREEGKVFLQQRTGGLEVDAERLSHQPILLQQDENASPGTSSKSWFERLRDSSFSFLFGILLVILSPYLIGRLEYWNMLKLKSYDNAGRLVLQIQNPSAPSETDLKPSKRIGAGCCGQGSALDDEMGASRVVIHATGRLDVPEGVRDPVFPDVKASDFLRLRRQVQIYQRHIVEEKERQVGGREVTREHVKEGWFHQPQVDGKNSQLKNETALWDVLGRDTRGPFVVPPPRLGSFLVHKEMLLGCHGEKPPVRVQVGGKEEGEITVKKDGEGVRGRFRPNPQGDGYSTERHYGQPENGDVRVTFEADLQRESRYSFLGAATMLDLSTDGKEGPVGVEAVRTRGRAACLFPKVDLPSVLLMEEGLYSPREMLNRERGRQATRMTIMRVLCFLLLFLGWVLIFRPLVVLADVIPLLGDLVAVSFLLAAAVLSCTCFTAVEAVFFFALRPIMTLLVVAVVLGGSMALTLYAGQLEGKKMM